jgi:protein-disulfide isomerase
MSESSTLSSQASADSAERDAEEVARRRHRRRRRITLCSVFGVFIVLGGLIGWGIYEAQKEPNYRTPAHASATADGIVAGGTGKTRVDVYVDYQCQECKTFDAAAAPTFDKLVASNAITLVYHPLALLDAQSKTQYSTRAAASAGCASDEENFLAYSQLLLAAQPKGTAGLSDDQMVQIAGRAGIIDPNFARCTRATNYRSWVAHVNSRAALKHITSTPTVLVKGRSIAPVGTTPTLAELNAALNIVG